MFARWKTSISRLHWGWQVPLWPLFGVVWVIAKIFEKAGEAFLWVLSEMGGQAKAKAKKTIAPWLWPIVGILVFLLLCSAIASQNLPTAQLVQAGQVGFLLLAALWLMYKGFRIMIMSPFTSGKPKKKKKK